MSIKLKLLRVQAGLTLEELAQAADLTRSYVSKLERGISTPSVGAALKLAKALHVQVEEVFAEPSDNDPVLISRAQATASPDARAKTPRVVSGASPDRRMIAFVLTPTEEPVRNHPMSHHKGEELLYVLKGRVSLQLAGRVELLNAGDSAHFNSSIPHKITSVGKQQASVLLVVAQEE
ncbi:helix-turn-helix domain-containing protein [Variovorax sp. VaC1]|uniref:helix-turn-helix domain-containing protein n=1 Tax=Variovorax sp. VaC1 TaxID=3373132 RepID=UPI00374A90A0